MVSIAMAASLALGQIVTSMLVIKYFRFERKTEKRLCKLESEAKDHAVRDGRVWN